MGTIIIIITEKHIGSSFCEEQPRSWTDKFNVKNNFIERNQKKTVYLYKEGMAIAEKTDRKNAKFQLAMVCIKQATCVVNTRSHLLV